MSKPKAGQRNAAILAAAPVADRDAAIENDAEDDVAAEAEDEALEPENLMLAAPAPIAPNWLLSMRQSSSRRGFYHSGDDFAAVHVDRGADQLVVGFDNLSSVRDDPVSRDPWGFQFVEKNGWSQLGIMTFRPNWFRDDDLFRYLAGLAESGFFARFRHVTMTGTSMGGYAACAFARFAPGCSVLAFSPQSTLRRDLVPWEKRYSSGRKADWTGPFADAAETTQEARDVWLVYDPFLPDDARQIARFHGPNIHLLKARHSGHKTALFLRRADMLSATVRDVIEGRMSAQRFHAAYRAGRSLPWFLSGLAERAHARGRHDLLRRMMLHLRGQGHGAMAHQIRKKYLSGPAHDPLRRSPPALER